MQLRTVPPVSTSGASPSLNSLLPTQSGSNFNRLRIIFQESYGRVASLAISILTKITFKAVEDRSKNPLYRSLPSIKTTVLKLLDLPRKEKGFEWVPFRESLSANWIPTAANFFEDAGVKIAEREYNVFCQRIANKDLQHPFSITPIIHFIWLGSSPPPAVEMAMESWSKHNPKYEIKLWTDQEVQNFEWSSSHSKLFYKSAKNWAEKSDILRFEILYQFGGIYSDTDAVCVGSFDDLMTNGLTFFAGFESNIIKRFGRPLIGSAVIGAEKNSPIIKRCLDFSLTAEEAPTIHQFIRSGPGPITKASYEALENGVKNALLLPCSYLYPLPWEKRLSSPDEVVCNIRPESCAIHLWEGSWFDDYIPPKS